MGSGCGRAGSWGWRGRVFMDAGRPGAGGGELMSTRRAARRCWWRVSFPPALRARGKKASAPTHVAACMARASCFLPQEGKAGIL